MAADLTAQAAASAAVGVATAIVGEAFGLTLACTMCGLLGALGGLAAVKEPIGPVRSMVQFAVYGIGGAVVATWAASSPPARNALAIFCGFIGNPAARIVWARADQLLAPTFDRIFGTAATKTKGKKP